MTPAAAAQSKFRIQKLVNPTDQVGMPMSHKWAVLENEEFLEAFRLKRHAKHYIEMLTGKKEAL